MALIKQEKIKDNQYEIEFSIPKEKYDESYDKVFKSKSKKITIPGFRKGKAPRHIVEKMYGKEIFFEDAINEILPEAYNDALKSSKLDAVSRPEFDSDSIKIDDTIVDVKAKIYVKPDVEIENYEGIKVETHKSSTTDDEIMAELNQVRERNARMVDINDRPVKQNDIVTIDYIGKVDDEAFEGGSDKNYDLTIGSHQFIPGFEEQLIGHKCGEIFDITVDFPSDYQAEKLAGKSAVFNITINAIKEKILSKIDDDFAKDYSDFETLADYKKDISNKIDKKHEDEYKHSIAHAISDYLSNNIKADIPEPMFVNETENQLRDFDMRLKSQGLDLNTYLKYTNSDLDKARTMLRPEAEKQTKINLALDKISDNEKIQITEEEIENEKKRIAESYGVELKQVNDSIDNEDIKYDLKQRKTMDYLISKAIVTEPKEKDSNDVKEKAKSKTKNSEKNNSQKNNKKSQ